MADETNDGYTSQEFADDFKEVVDTRTDLEQQQAGETARLLRFDDPEFNDRLYDQAYYELYFDSPVKQLLWKAEELAEWAGGFKLDSFGYDVKRLEDCLRVDIVEAYAHIMPGEGYDLLQQMQDNWAKVEAMAKFARLTSPDFVEKARALAFSVGGTSYDVHQKYDLLLCVAKYANDDESLQMAYDELDASGCTTNGDWDILTRMADIASLGHMQALLDLKKALPMAMHGLNSGVNVNARIQFVATVNYIDELIKRGHISTRILTVKEHEPEVLAIEREWAGFLEKYAGEITAALKEGIYLNDFTALTDELDASLLVHEVSRKTALKKLEDINSYLDSTYSRFVQFIAKNGPDGLSQAMRQTAFVDKKVLPTEKDAKISYQEFGESNIALVSVLENSRFTEEDMYKAMLKDGTKIIQLFNRIALVKAVPAAALQLQASAKTSKA